jgi:hypothetical protein
MDILKTIVKYVKAFIDYIMEYMTGTWKKWDKEFEEEDKQKKKGGDSKSG